MFPRAYLSKHMESADERPLVCTTCGTLDLAQNMLQISNGASKQYHLCRKDERGRGQRMPHQKKPLLPPRKRVTRQKAQPAITLGMRVEANQGDLDAPDISAAHVIEVDRDPTGHIDHVVVEKGLIFREQIAVPADRIEAVLPARQAEPAKVIVKASEAELDALGAVGTAALPTNAETQPAPPKDVLEQAEEELPTVEGLRRREGRRRGGTSAPAPTMNVSATPPTSAKGLRGYLQSLGPGMLAGMAGNDASAVTSYSINGATNGYGQLWLMLLATPMFQAVQFACGKVGRVSQKGFSTLLRERYGLRVAIPATIILIIANVGLVTGDLVAIGSGLELITGIAWVWFVVPAAALLWYVTLFQNFDTIKKVFLVMSLAFITYLVTGFVAHPQWGEVLRHTFVPSLGTDFASISAAVALLGATVSPYTMFWQVQGEKEQVRPGNLKTQIKASMWDVANGVISGNLIAYFIIVATSATLFVHHQQIATAADAARSLAPLVGPYAKYLFAVGLIGAGLVAIPVLLASTAYAVAGTFGWTASLWKKPWQNEGFYLTISVALLLSLIVALFRFNPIAIMFGANVLQGLLAPILVVMLILVANDRRIMGSNRATWLTNAFLVLTALVLCAAELLFFIGLFHR